MIERRNRRRQRAFHLAIINQHPQRIELAPREPHLHGVIMPVELAARPRVLAQGMRCAETILNRHAKHHDFPHADCSRNGGAGIIPGAWELCCTARNRNRKMVRGTIFSITITRLCKLDSWSVRSK